MGGDLPRVSRSVPLDKACAIEVQMDGFSVPHSRSVSDQTEGVQCRYLPATIKTETVILSRNPDQQLETLTAKRDMFSSLFL
jgi:monomeric isocitrate dehydrogenase